jgi:hypothetical protein
MPKAFGNEVIGKTQIAAVNDENSETLKILDVRIAREDGGSSAVCDVFLVIGVPGPINRYAKVAVGFTSRREHALLINGDRLNMIHFLKDAGILKHFSKVCILTGDT